jgi:hypothetical protein
MAQHHLADDADAHSAGPRADEAEQVLRHPAFFERRQRQLRIRPGRPLLARPRQAQEVRAGLATADWKTKRDIIRALIKRIELDDDEVRIVYRVAPVPFVEARIGGFLQDCPKGADTFDFRRPPVAGRFWASG